MTQKISAFEGKILFVRLAFVNFSPVIKRLFWFLPEIYYLISFAALLAVFRASFNRNRVIISLLLLSMIAIGGDADKAVTLYGPMFVVWVFAPTYSYEEVENIFWKLRYIFLLSMIYAVIQKIFGFMSFELGWINSDLGMVRAEGYFVTEEIRPFSFYAGSPEFGFFSCIMIYFALQRRSLFFLCLGILGVYIAGSRGVMVSVIIALSVLYLPKKISPKMLTIIGFTLSIGAYLFLAIILPLTGFLEAKDDSSRLLVYGTFGYRVVMLLELWAQVDIYNIWYGIGAEKNIFDNFFLTLLNDVGILGGAIFLIAVFWNITTRCAMFFAIVILSFCQYSDALFSVYLIYNAFMLLNVKPTFHKERTSLE